MTTPIGRHRRVNVLIAVDGSPVNQMGTDASSIVAYISVAAGKVTIQTRARRTHPMPTNPGPTLVTPEPKKTES